MAPEILLGQKYNYKIDTWAIGVMLFLMLTGEFPFNGLTCEDLFKGILFRPVIFTQKILPLKNLSP